MENQIKRIDRTLMHKGAIVDFYSDKMLMPDGRTVDYDLVHHRRGAACVIPVMPDGKLLMVHQYRNALERITTEFPAGARDSTTEDTAICAARELEEETGYKPGKVEYFFSLRPTIAYCDEFIDVYLATDLTEGVRHLDPDEFVEIETYELDDLIARIFSGEIQDGKTVAGILAYAAKIRK